MKKIVSFALCIVSVLCLALSSCSGSAVLTYEKGKGYIDSKSGGTYVHASTCYRPIALGEEYGEMKIGDSITYKVYAVKGMKTEEWLSTEDKDILCKEGTKLPTLTEMKPHTLRICTTEKSGLEIKRISDSKTVEAIANNYASGERVTYPMIAAAKKYSVKFDGDVLDGICYELTYLEYAEDIEFNGVSVGKYFLYDNYEKIFVPIGNEINLALRGTDAEGTSTSADTGGAV